MQASTLGYAFLVYRRESLWLPASLWAICALVAFLFRAEPRSVEIAGAYLSYLLPLSAGVLASGAVLDDPSLELQFSTPRPVWRLLLERLGLILGLVAVGSLAIQVYLALIGVDLGHYGGIVTRQLLWMAPSLCLGAFGSLTALAGSSSTLGALLVGLVWLVQLLARDWFLTDQYGRYIFLYLAERAPGSPHLPANEISLALLAILFALASTLLLRREERYL